MTNDKKEGIDRMMTVMIDIDYDNVDDEDY
jgi:hypothetical protein